MAIPRIERSDLVWAAVIGGACGTLSGITLKILGREGILTKSCGTALLTGTLTLAARQWKSAAPADEQVFKIPGLRRSESASNTIQVYAKTLDNNTFTVDGLTPTSTIFDFSCRASQQLQIPVETLRVIFGGKQLGPTTTLGRHSIVEQSTLHLVPRTGGSDSQSQPSGNLNEFVPVYLAWQEGREISVSSGQLQMWRAVAKEYTASGLCAAVTAILNTWDLGKGDGAAIGAQSKDVDRSVAN